jgi:hypothetical protein
VIEVSVVVVTSPFHSLTPAKGTNRLFKNSFVHFPWKCAILTSYQNPAAGILLLVSMKRNTVMG